MPFLISTSHLLPFVFSPDFPDPSFWPLLSLSEFDLSLPSRQNYWDQIKGTDYNYPKLPHAAQVIREQERNDSKPSTTWDSDSGPSSNLVEQSHSFLRTKLAQGLQ